MRWVAVGLLWAGAATAEGWVPLNGEQIRAALTDRKFVYPADEIQEFYASGRTLYVTARPSWGYWEVRSDQYCSLWPPSDLWACYDVAQKGEAIRFIGSGGDTYDASPKD